MHESMEFAGGGNLMQSKSDAFIADLLNFGFNGVAIPGAGASSLYVSLHTESPGAGGDQSTNEASYIPYARVAIARTSGGWTIVGDHVHPFATIQFASPTAGFEIEGLLGVGTALAGGGSRF